MNEYCCVEFEYLHDKGVINQRENDWVILVDDNFFYIFYCPFCGEKL